MWDQQSKDKKIANEWININPELCNSPIELITQFVLFSNDVSNTRHNFCKKYSLTPSEFDIIATLYRVGEPNGLIAKELKERTFLPSSGALANRLDRLESKKLIKRHHDTQDKRSIIITLSVKGIALIEEITPLFFDSLSELFNTLSNSEKKDLQRLMEKLLLK